MAVRGLDPGTAMSSRVERPYSAATAGSCASEASNAA